MATTMRDIANVVGVSAATVSNVLNGRSQASKDIAMKVMKAARELEYSPIKRNIKANKGTNSITIALLIRGDVQGGWSNVFYTEVIRGVTKVVNEHNGNIFYLSIDDEHIEQLHEKLKNRELDGILSVGYIDPGIINEAHEFGLRVISVDQANPQVTSVLSANLDGALEAVNYLIKLAHKNIAFIGGPKEQSSFLERANGYKLALLDHNLPVNQDNIMFMSEGEVDEGYKAMKGICERGKVPDAVFCGNDQLACGALRAISENGLCVPKDISIVGFDDSGYAIATTPKLTTVKVYAYDIGYLSASIMLDYLSNLSHNMPKKILVPTKLIKRASCSTRRT